MAERAPAPRKVSVEAKLVCRAGPSMGEEFPLTGAVQVIGRATDAEISIPDTSVSRRHLKVFKRQSEWMVADLGSGNGTVVNGEKIQAETVLHHGDVMTLGDTELSFVDLANITDKAAIPVRVSGSAPASGSPLPRAADTRTRSRPRGSRYRQSVTEPPKARRRTQQRIVVLLVAGGVLMALWQVKKVADQAKEQRRKADIIAEQKTRELDEVYQEADRLSRSGDWKSAQEKYKHVAAVDEKYPEVQEKIERAEQEIPNQDALAEAEAALAKSHLGEAAAALKKVSDHTVMVHQVVAARSELETKAEAQVEAARKALDAHQPQTAIRLSQDVLDALPEQRDAKALNEQAKGSGKPSKHLVESVKTSPWSDAVSRFVEEDLPGALAAAKACAAKTPRCRALVRQIGEYAELQKQGDSLDSRQHAKLKELEHEISEGRGSNLSHAADSKEANLQYKKALAAKAQGEMGKAAQYAKQALDLDPNLAGAKALAGDLRGQAKQVFLDGYAEVHEDKEDAIKKFKEVLDMTAPEDEYHRKAEHWLETLRQ